MLKDLFSFRCPCCGKSIELDTRSGIARAAKPEEQQSQKDLDKMLADSKKEADRLDSFFKQAKDQQKKNQDRIEGLFGDAIEDAKKDKDKTRPRNPFDLE